MSRHNFSLANQVYFGRATYAPYQANKPGVETTPVYRYKAMGARVAAFTGALAAGATGGTLSAVWAGATGLFAITFSDTSVLRGLFTNGSTAVTFYPASAPQAGGSYGALAPLVGAVTANITVANQPPILGTANSIGLSQSVTAATAGLLNGATAGVLDVPRNVIAAWTGAAILTVVGTDFWGAPQTESSASGTSFTGKKAFSSVTSYSFSANVTAATVGTGAVLGLPFKAVTGDIIATRLADAADAGTFVQGDPTAVATATTGDVRGTYACGGALDGVKFPVIVFKVYDPSTQSGAFGVTPA